MIRACLFIACCTLQTWAGIYWVSPTGSSSWASAESASPLSGAACASVNTANSNAVAGDIVYFRGGSYGNKSINPSNNGTSGNRITFEAYTGETPIFTDTSGADTISIWIRRSYITIKGMTVDETGRHLLIDSGDYVEIADCTFQGRYRVNQIKMYDVANDGNSVEHLWFHGNTVAVQGSISGDPVDDNGGTQHGIFGNDDLAANATFENNDFRLGGHHNLETYGPNNVVRNNTWFHANAFTNGGPGTPKYAPDDNGKWGNRNYQIEYQQAGNARNVVEGNRFGPSGTPPDDDGGDGVSIVSNANIFRYNQIYGAQNNGILLKDGGAGGDADNNRIYNNTIYGSGRYDNTNGGSPISPYTGAQWQGAAIRYYTAAVNGNISKNNILYGGNNNDFAGITGTNTEVNNWKNADGDPSFVDTTVSSTAYSASQPDLTLQSGSGAINNGGSLTLADGLGANSTSLTVDDASYFQDGSVGSALSDIQADWIAIETVDNIVAISSIDYGTNVITLASSMTWSDNADVWLYSNTSGNRVLYGSAPDQGALEHPQGGSFIRRSRSVQAREALLTF